MRRLSLRLPFQDYMTCDMRGKRAHTNVWPTKNLGEGNNLRISFFLKVVPL